MNKKKVNEVEIMFLEDQHGIITHLAIFVPIDEIEKVRSWINYDAFKEVQ